MQTRHQSVDPAKLVPADGNPQRMAPETFAALKAALGTDADTVDEPAVWKDPTGKLRIISGHHRIRAARELGWKTVKVKVFDDPTCDELWYRKRVLSVNKTHGDPDHDAVRAFLTDTMARVDIPEFDALAYMSDSGYTDAEIRAYLTPGIDAGGTDPDALPERPPARVKAGELWRLGEHRLLCGDATSMTDIERLLGGTKPDLVYTDPPYGMSERTDRQHRKTTFKAKPVAPVGRYEPVIGDDTTATALEAHRLCQLLGVARMVFWGANHFAGGLPSSAAWLVWDKRTEDKYDDINSDCELAWVKHPHKASVRIFRHLWKGMLKASEHGEARVHPTQKPVALAMWAFDEIAKGMPVVLDLFLGSGSTLIACENTSRRCYGLEIDPHYCDIVIERWQQATGQEAMLISP